MSLAKKPFTGAEPGRRGAGEAHEVKSGGPSPAMQPSRASGGAPDRQPPRWAFRGKEAGASRVLPQGADLDRVGARLDQKADISDILTPCGVYAREDGCSQGGAGQVASPAQR